jgi:hypothetical protein
LRWYLFRLNDKFNTVAIKWANSVRRNFKIPVGSPAMGTLTDFRLHQSPELGRKLELKLPATPPVRFAPDAA